MPRARRVAFERLLYAGRLGVFALAIVGGLLGIGVFWTHVTTDPLADVHAYYEAAKRLAVGASLYPAGASPDAADFYRYPPLLAITLRPLVGLSYAQFALVWEAGMVLAFVATLRIIGVKGRRWLAVGLLGFPIGFCLSVGQAQVLVTLMIALGQPWSLALATHLKLFPALAALWWAGRRDWQALGAFAGWTLLLGLVQLALEPRATIDFLGTLTPSQIGHLINFSPWVVNPLLWWLLLVLGAGAAVIFARTRWGWAIAVTLATLAPPRLISYLLMSLLAALREPRSAVAESVAGAAAASGVPDAAEASVRSAR